MALVLGRRALYYPLTMPSRQPILRRSPRLHPLRRSPRLAALAAIAAAAAEKPRRRATIPHKKPLTEQTVPSTPAVAPVMYETNDINERPRKRQKTQYEPQPISPSSSSDTIDDMTEEEFHAFNDALSDEDKEIQASLLMWCISRCIPYTLDLFHEYKRNIQEIRAMGLL